MKFTPQIPMVLRTKIVLALFTLLMGCSPSTCFRTHIHQGEQQGLSPSHPNYTQTIQVKYFGTSGFLIRHGDAALLLAPFFSNRSILNLFKPKSDTTTINTHLQSLSLKGIESIIVGHAHYDHLLDVPYIANKYFLSQNKPLAIYGSQTMKNLISNEKNPEGIPANHLIAIVGDSISTHRHIGPDIYIGNNKRIRLRAIKSMHAPHFGSVTFFDGQVKEPVQAMPKWVTQWKEGQTLSYLIDFLDEQQQPIFRIHYQDAASDSLISMPNDELIKDKSVDLSILCVAAFKNAKNYPEAILQKLQPKHAILAHWEDFFGDYNKNLNIDTAQHVSLTDPCEFIDAVEKTASPNLDWKMPLPNTWIFYPTQ